ncbi:MAG TPA: SDR family oxidoreductase [Steroidobacter sp.]|nr:SDR family oxidoreductase [Steroidobacter sp.]
MAIVTGATRGIGKACALSLARQGFDVTVTGRTQKEGDGAATMPFARDGRQVAVPGSLETTVEAVQALGREALPVRMDVLDRASMDQVVAQTLERWGRIDVLVNSAGHGPRKPILEITDEDWHAGIDVYFLSAVRPMRLVVPTMQKQKSGAIVNISTTWAFEPSAMFPTSAVARAGLAAFTKVFADTYAADNIRMNNVLPGWIDSLPATEERRSSVPMQRYGRSEEIAATIAFLVSDGAAYITGQNIRVDGGVTKGV